MIPTREQIDVSNGILCAMRDEIDRLTGDLNQMKNSLANAARDELIAERDRLTADIISLKADAVRLQSNLDMTNTQLAKARDAMAKASDPVREEEIRAWEEDATLHRCGSRFDDDDPRATYLMARSEITAAVAMMRRADGKALLRGLREWVSKHSREWLHPEWIGVQDVCKKIDEMLAQPAPPSAEGSFAFLESEPNFYDPKPATVEHPAAAVPEKLICDRNGCGKERPPYAWMSSSKGERKYCCFKCMEDDRSDFLQGGAAPVEQPAAAVTDHVPDAGKMVPVLYWLEDGKFARAMLVGKDLLVVDLTFGDGPSVVGKPEWFDAGYVAAYGGLVPESATQGKEPGQWDYGVASIAKPAAAVPDDCGLGQITAEMVQAGIAAVKAGRWVSLEQLRKELAPVHDDTRELVARLCDLLRAKHGHTVMHPKLFDQTLESIAAELRGGA